MKKLLIAGCLLATCVFALPQMHPAQPFIICGRDLYTPIRRFRINKSTPLYRGACGVLI